MVRISEVQAVSYVRNHTFFDNRQAVLIGRQVSNSEETGHC